MATRRSLNKLERRAHMSLHDTVEAKDENEVRPGEAYTRDRFGKRQRIDRKTEPDDEGNPSVNNYF